MPKICAFKIFAPEPIERQPTGQRPELCNMEGVARWRRGYDDFASWVRHLAAIWFSCLARRWHPFFRPPFVGHRPRTWLPFWVLCLLFALGRRLFDCMCVRVCVLVCVLLPRASLIIYLWLSSLPAFVLFPSSFIRFYCLPITNRYFPAGPQGTNNEVN